MDYTNIQKIIKDYLRKFTLKLNIIYTFTGMLSMNKETKPSKCSLAGGTIFYLIVFNTKFKPVSNLINYGTRKIISTFDGFYLEYSLVDQTLIFYTTNDNDFLGSYILDESIFPDNKNNNPNNIIIPHTCPGSYTPFDAFCQQCQLIHNSYSSQPCNACVSNGQTG